MNRVDRVKHQLQKEISFILQKELSDPRLEFVSITEVDVSPDLRNAKVYFSMLAEMHPVGEIEKVLTGARGRIRKFVGSRMRLRYTPELTFIYDDAIDSSFKIDAALKEISDEQDKDH